MKTTEILKINKPEEAVRFFKNKLSFTLGPMDIELARKEKEKPDYNLIDVRAADDFKKEHIPGAVNLPEEEWATLRGLSKDKLNVVYCYNITCHLAARAALFFAEKGYPISELHGGFESYKEHELDVETGETKAA